MVGYLIHYGMPRRSGRYPWGSGKRPNQHSGGASKAQFDSETKKVESKLSNSVKPFEKQQLDLKAVSQRGGLSYNEAGIASKYGVKVFESASKLEPAITKDITSAADSAGSKMYGLEYRLKQPTSLSAKIGSDAKEKRISFDKAAYGIKDSIRYTVVSQNNNFVNNYNKIKTKLSNKGYEEVTCKNYFQQYKDGKVKHKSVQSIFKDKNGNKFEVQFQTPESQAAKELKIPIYEERRKLTNSASRNAELEYQMTKLAELVPIPKNVYSIREH